MRPASPSPNPSPNPTPNPKQVLASGEAQYDVTFTIGADSDVCPRGVEP